MEHIPNDHEQGFNAGFAAGQKSRAKEIVALKRCLRVTEAVVEAAHDLFTVPTYGRVRIPILRLRRILRKTLDAYDEATKEAE